MEKIILKADKWDLGLGDIIQMTIAVRDLALAHPGKYQIDVRTRIPDVWLNNPYLTKLEDKEAETIIINYGLINNAGSMHFSDAFRLSLQEKLDLKIPWTVMDPDLHLSKEERDDKVVARLSDYPGSYWVVTAGWKGNETLKYYPWYQEVVNLLSKKIIFVQVGSKEDTHPPLKNVINLTGKTGIRDYFKVIAQAQGSLGAISAQMHIAAAFKKPCVVIANATESPRWEMYNGHRFISMVGCLPCAPENGCWKGNANKCVDLVGGGIPRCQAMITPEMVAREIENYYTGGILTY